jgi:hypothetical protein
MWWVKCTLGDVPLRAKNMKTKARDRFLLPLAAALLAAPDLTAQPLLPTPAAEPQWTQPFFDSAALLGLEPDRVLRVPLPADGARLDRNCGRQPLHLARNDGQTDAEERIAPGRRMIAAHFGARTN